MADVEKSSNGEQIEETSNGNRVVDFSSEDEARVVRKIDWHLPPLVAFLCTFLSSMLVNHPAHKISQTSSLSSIAPTLATLVSPA